MNFSKKRNIGVILFTYFILNGTWADSFKRPLDQSAFVLSKALPSNMLDQFAHRFFAVQFEVADVNVLNKGAKCDGVTDDHVALQSAADAVPLYGGNLIFPSRRVCATSAALILHSHTHVEGFGATMLALASWPRPPSGREGYPDKVAGYTFVANQNLAASSLIDTDLSITDMTFDASAIGPANVRGGFHAVRFRKVQSVRIDSVTGINVGDVTALLASNDTQVIRSRGIGVLNACFDHWESPQNTTVKNNECDTSSYGILFTAADTGHNAGVGEKFVASGNWIHIVSGSSGGACIWANTLNSRGVLNDVIVTENHCNGNNTDTAGYSITGGVISAIISKNIAQNIGGAISYNISPEFSNQNITTAIMIGNICNMCSTGGTNPAFFSVVANYSLIQENVSYGGDAASLIWAPNSNTNIMFNNSFGSTIKSSKYNTPSTSIVIDDDQMTFRQSNPR